MIYAGITISTITQLIEIIFYLSLRASVKAPAGVKEALTTFGALVLVSCALNNTSSQTSISSSSSMK